jgi:hypothetical protein
MPDAAGQLCSLKAVLTLIQINEISKDMMQSICGRPFPDFVMV